nr:MAG TPA: hypothetical protein [Caudoviricetes sp.]
MTLALSKPCHIKGLVRKRRDKYNFLNNCKKA